LNLKVVETETKSEGREFQIGTTRDEKKNFLISFLAMGTDNLRECPLDEGLVE
jgi:hypothetical protein